jgi:hypothetical protein
MEKERENFSKEEIPFLNQLVKSLEEAELKLEKAHEKKDYEKFNKSKKFMLEIQKQISNLIR